MEFFAKVFNALAALASRLPKIDVGSYFIIVAVALVAVGIIIGLTYFSSSAGKMKRAAKKVLAYLDGKEEINDDNAADFTNQCFGNSAPRLLREAWVKYLGVRFGYPTDVITEKGVFDAEVKKFSNARANVFIAIALVLTGAFAFWGLGANASATVGVIVGAGLILSGIIYLVLVALSKKQYKKARECFYAMQDELDAKVDFHVEKDYSTDASPLLEMTSMIDEIIGRNTAKVVQLPTEEEEKTADADKAKEESAEVAPVEAEQAVKTEPVDETPSEPIREITPIEQIVAVAEQEPVPEEQQDDAATEEAVEDERIEEPNPAIEIAAAESIAETQAEPVEEDAPIAVEEEAVDSAAEQSEASPLAVDVQDNEASADESAVETAAEDNAENEDIPSVDAPVEETVAENADGEVVPSEEEQALVETSEAEEKGEEEIPFVPIVLPERSRAQEETDVEDIANLKIGTATMTKNKAVRNVLKDEGVGDWLAGQNEFGMATPVEAFEEVNIEDEEVMFGKKKKEKEAAAALEAAQQQAVSQPAAAPAKPAKVYADSEVFVESELMSEPTPAPVAETAPVSEPAPAVEPAPVAAPAPVEESAPAAEPERPDFKRTLVAAAPVVELEPEVIEEYEDLDEGDEDIKAPRLSKLPHLVDYVLSTNVSRMTKIKVAQLMFQAFVVFKNSPENKAIVIQCLMKVMASLKSAE